ncbi:XRE family transcriptional regulator [Lacrimispora sp. NSJ-141]|uniref:XRE family transcriptional regulator n=1 Tax=Lientehia hominis TaxID=2897778 RepID=A0AAP2WAD0_9FIRM|nr:XRE family transcriptional regulator [Lientehia hominis]MCD2492984.1 XRE family transcriptional regulator [Lientehia hominis]
MDRKTTDELLKILGDVTSERALEKYVEDHTKKPEGSLSGYLEKTLAEKGLEKSSVIQASGLQRNYGYQIFSGTRGAGRDKLLALCIAMKMTAKEVQKALQLAGLNGLYARVRRDAVLIFAVNKGLSVLDTNELLDEMGESILE